MFFRIVWNTDKANWQLEISKATYLGFIHVWVVSKLGETHPSNGFDTFEEAKKYICEKGIDKVYTYVVEFNKRMSGTQHEDHAFNTELLVK